MRHGGRYGCVDEMARSLHAFARSRSNDNFKSGLAPSPSQTVVIVVARLSGSWRPR